MPYYFPRLTQYASGSAFKMYIRFSDLHHVGTGVADVVIGKLFPCLYRLYCLILYHTFHHDHSSIFKYVVNDELYE